MPRSCTPPIRRTARPHRRWLCPPSSAEPVPARMEAAVRACENCPVALPGAHRSGTGRAPADCDHPTAIRTDAKKDGLVATTSDLKNGLVLNLDKQLWQVL